MTLHAASSLAPSSPAIIHRSPWHSPVPYLFGGLAAMLSLIAFALLILACSYSKHAAGNRENEGNGETDLEAGISKSGDSNEKSPPVYEEKYLVIMAGEAKPTFLATPVSSRVSSFGSCSCRSNSTENSSASEEAETNENEKENQGSSDQLQVRTTGSNQETIDHRS